MIDVPDTDVVPLIALVPLQASLQGQVVDIQPALLDSVLSITTFQHSRYVSSTSWLLEEDKFSSKVLVSLVAHPLQGDPTPVQFSPVNLADSLKPVADFLEMSADESSQIVDLEAQSKREAQFNDEPQGSTLKNWVAISDIRIVPIELPPSDDLPMPGYELFAGCTSLPSEMSLDVGERSQSSLATPSMYQLWFKDQYLGVVNDPEQAEILAQQIRQLIRQPDLDATTIVPVITEAKMTVNLGDEALLTIDEGMAQSLGYRPEWMVVSWANNLRQVLGAEPLDAGTVEMALAQFEASDVRFQGTASWYGPYFHGRITATGEVFDQYQLTVAHKTLPFGTQLKVRNLRNDRTVVVRVNDRGPYIGKRSLDLSKAAAQCLGGEHAGVIAYEAVILQEAVSLEAETLALSPEAALASHNN